eukprot:CAMPEP_0119570552 /NCGR_PEP_ID=MMETSP1352-20130426/43672_1 /TAXON_ID=265584 /ORGANISM="Stauroneis constricta, Strain CCMP1120" /LENGTH=447 /DNA_ID=CAMNT_0007620221 /DNA_START=457 /DNA_END=1800 /DNA_ORIENTATION=-
MSPSNNNNNNSTINSNSGHHDHVNEIMGNIHDGINSTIDATAGAWDKAKGTVSKSIENIRGPDQDSNGSDTESRGDKQDDRAIEEVVQDGIGSAIAIATDAKEDAIDAVENIREAAEEEKKEPTTKQTEEEDGHTGMRQNLEEAVTDIESKIEMAVGNLVGHNTPGEDSNDKAQLEDEKARDDLAKSLQNRLKATVDFGKGAAQQFGDVAGASWESAQAEAERVNRESGVVDKSKKVAADAGHGIAIAMNQMGNFVAATATKVDPSNDNPPANDSSGKPNKVVDAMKGEVKSAVSGLQEAKESLLQENDNGKSGDGKEENAADAASLGAVDQAKGQIKNAVDKLDGLVHNESGNSKESDSAGQRGDTKRTGNSSIQRGLEEAASIAEDGAKKVKDVMISFNMAHVDGTAKTDKKSLDEFFDGKNVRDDKSNGTTRSVVAELDNSTSA